LKEKSEICKLLELLLSRNIHEITLISNVVS
jgi:hypothetical protein